TLVADLYEGEKRAHFLGVQGAFIALGGTASVVGGGLLADWSWRAPFAPYLASLAVLPPLLLCVPRPQLSQQSNDRRPAENIPWRTVVCVYAVALVGVILFYIIPIQLPFLLARRMAASGIEVGIVLGVSTTSSAGAALITARLSARIGRHAVLVITCALPAIGLAWMGVAYSWPGLLGGAILGGIGLGMVLPNLTAWLAEMAPVEQRGRMLGGLTTCIFLGQFLSPIVFTPFVGDSGEVARVFPVGAAASGALAAAVAVYTLLRRKT
ncbi:MAG: MFS transporter, partial [Myxococcota bacterium]